MTRMKKHGYLGLALRAAWALSLIILLWPTMAPAQQAYLEIDQGGAEGAATTDPHPAHYIWEGDVTPIKGEPAEYYTFFYTGEVTPDATVPPGTEIQRVAIPNSQWQTYKSTMISLLAGFYNEAYGSPGNADNSTFGGREVTFDDDFNYVYAEDDPGQQQNTAGIDPRAAAEWTFYYDQMVLWQFYCRRVLLNDRSAAKANSSAESLQRIVDIGALNDFNIDPEDVAKALDAIESTRAAQEEGALATGAQPGPDEAEPATLFDPDADFADPEHNELYREEFIRLAVRREELAKKIFQDMISRIDSRNQEKERYSDWLDREQMELIEFARAWSKVQAGQRVNFDDTFYLITKEPLESVPYDARNVIIREVVTPQDLIFANGLLKGSPLDHPEEK